MVRLVVLVLFSVVAVGVVGGFRNNNNHKTAQKLRPVHSLLHHDTHMDLEQHNKHNNNNNNNNNNKHSKLHNQKHHGKATTTTTTTHFDFEQQQQENVVNNNNDNNNNEDEAVLLAKAEAEAEKATIQMEDLESSVKRMKSEIDELKSDLRQAESELGTAKPVVAETTTTETVAGVESKETDKETETPKETEKETEKETDKETETPKETEKETEKEVASTEAPKNDLEEDDFDESFLQISGIDMNDGVEDDESSAPTDFVARMNRNSRTVAFAQSQAQQDDEEEVGPFKPEKEPERGAVNGRLIPVAADGALNVEDEIPTGETGQPSSVDRVYSEEMTVANVAQGDPVADTPSNPTRTDIKPDNLSGSKNQAPNATVEEKDVVCVCKRTQQAPRGFDRVRCKKHPSPSPTPTPLPPAGVKQCVKGPWAKGNEKGKTDTICVYFPHTAPPVEEEELKEPEYPPECYDDRNEWVAEGVQQRIKFNANEHHKMHQVLLQGEFESCGCED